MPLFTHNAPALFIKICTHFASVFLTDHARVGLDFGGFHGNGVLRSRPSAGADARFELGVTKSWQRGSLLILFGSQ